MAGKKKLFLHYGMSKTGSSSIQGSLYKKLHDRDFEYIDLGAASVNTHLITAFSEKARESHVIKMRGWPQDVIDQKGREVRALLRQSINRSTASNLILSAECLSSTFGESDLRRLKNFCDRIDVSSQAVGYVRRPKSFIESIFQQTLKAGPGRSLETCHKFYPNYQRRFARFDAVFGPENVHCWLFSPQQLYRGDVVSDFCKRTGIDLTMQRTVRQNDSLGLIAVSLLYIYRQYGEPFGVGPAAIRENQQLVAKLSEIGGPKFKLHSMLVQPVIEENYADISWMERRHNCVLREDLSAEDEFAVKVEDDFLRAAISALPWLEAQLQEYDTTPGPVSDKPAYIARLMGSLRKSLRERQSSAH